MKSALAFAILVCLLLAAASTAHASPTNWVINLRASDLDGSNYGTAQIGVKPTSTGAVDGWDPNDGDPIDMNLGAPVKWPAPVPAGATTAYTMSYMSTASYSTYPGKEKKWAFRVAGAVGTSGPIKLQFQTGTKTVTLPPTGPPYVYGSWGIKLVCDQGWTIKRPTWAPGAGSRWVAGHVLALTVPTTTNTFFGAIELPELILPNNSPLTMYNQGYQFQLLPLVPEPGSLLALSAGLIGLSALALRRRRI